MTEIVPRWEWRWFGRRLGPAESRLAALTPVGVQESDETYLLSGAGDNVKVRDALMDIKVLREVDGNGLEQWTPVMKAGFPLPASEVAKVVADGKPTCTVAVESEDAAAVIAAVRSLGLGGYLNTSYPRGLAALIDGSASRHAVIDVGTNSIKFHLAEHAADGLWHTVVDRAEITRLGESLANTRRIGDAALDSSIAASSGMVAEAQKHAALGPQGPARSPFTLNGF